MIKLNVVLVRTEYPSNVGASMRASLNMGGDRLILIDPRCELDSKARQMAAGAASRLADVVRYDSWKDFYDTEGEGLRIAMTRRGGRQRKVGTLAEVLQEYKINAGANGSAPDTAAAKNIYLIFGPEADGLDSEDLAYANYACHLPVHGDFASLNLAQAVLLAAFIVRQYFPAQDVTQFTGVAEPVVAPFYFPEDLIKRWLTAIGFDIDARRASAFLTLRRLFMMNQPTRHEYQVLEAILQQNVRKLTEKPEGSNPPCA